MNLILAIILPIISAGILFTVLNVMFRKITVSEGQEKPLTVNELQENVKKIEDSLKGMRINTADFVSRAQFEYASDSYARLQSAIESARNDLRTVEADLDTTQRDVEEREIKIQSLKGSKEEEAKLLIQIGQEFELLNKEAESLQENLVDSLENIKKLETELTLSKAQAEQLADFQNLVATTVGSLKELTVEGQEVERRLKVLSHQYKSLEEEYTKLVEQQFA